MFKEKLKNIRFPNKETKLIVLGVSIITLILVLYLTVSSISGGRVIMASSEEGCKHIGSFDYIVVLKPNLLYGQVVVGPGNKYFTNIIDYINSTYTYDVKCKQRISGTYKMSATIKTDQWRKDIILIEDANINTNSDQNGLELVITQPINISYYDDIVNNVDKEIGINNEKAELILNYDITTNEKFNHNISIPLNDKVIQINGSLIKERDNIITREVGKSADYYSVILFGILTIGMFVITIFVSKIDVREGGNTKKVLEEYKDIIVDGEPPSGDDHITIQPVRSMDSLVRISDDLVKPIIHISEGDRDILYILDVNIKYQYILEKES